MSRELEFDPGGGTEGTEDGQEGVSRQGGSLIRLGVFDGLRGVHWQGWNEMKKKKAIAIPPLTCNSLWEDS